ncbi:BON domain-containing protein [Pseudanabaena minima]|uniref:BON domain-containing protein n=1 Tax=Pseudanabaena minima TaxID=890415 RepID=UPI003DA7BA10
MSEPKGEQKGNFQNKALSDVEKFLLLLSELNIIDSEKPKSSQEQQGIQDASLLNIDHKDTQSIDIQSSQTSSRLLKSEQGLSAKSNPKYLDGVSLDTRSPNGQNSLAKPRPKSLDEDFSDIGQRSPSLYSFPSLLDELPFLRDIPPAKNGFDPNVKDRQTAEQTEGNLNLADNTKYSRLEQIEPSKKEEIETVNLIQEILLGSDKVQIGSPPIAQSTSLPPSQDISVPTSQPPLQPPQFQPSQPQISYLESSSDDEAIHMLQDILVVPELEDLRSFKIAVEQKLGIVESQVNNPEIMNKIEGLESLLHNASRRLSAMDDENSNIPMEIDEVRGRVAQLENQINQPAELVQLLLPIIAELLSIKADQAREEMCQAITPIIAEVIFERSQLDRLSMSHAIADLLPNAISEQIRNNPEQIAKALGPEVGAAIREQIRIDRDEIVDSLAPEMGSAIKRQIDLERDAMVDALYPVIGNTIAKYFAEAIRSINEKVEQTFSVEGIQRKIRARIQGVSEAELILKESVPFEIQAIFLIHNLSGLVMIDIQKSDLDSLVEPIDSDMLAGMLTAIRSFANECISRSESTTELDAINYSGSKILLEVAGYCYLAVIIQGEPDAALVNKIRDVFGRVVQSYGDRFKEFDGDTSTIPKQVEIQLKTLIEVEQAKSSKQLPQALILTVLAVLALICIPIGIYQHQSNRDRQLEAKVLEAFASTPELAVYRLNVTANGEHLKLGGKLPNQHLRDRALQVAISASKAEIEISKINNSIYTVNIPPDPELVAIEVQRLTKALNYTQGVNIQSQFKDGQVTITGLIEQPRLIPKITQTFTKIAGITTVSNAATIQTPKISTRIYFPIWVTTLEPSDTEKLIEVQAFLDLYPDYNLKILVKNDNIGDRAINYQLGMKRAQTVRDALLQRGVNAKRLHISGIIDVSVQQPSDQMLRWVEFQPILKPMSVSN